MVSKKAIGQFFKPSWGKILLFLCLIIIVSLATLFATSCHPKFNILSYVYLIVIIINLAKQSLFLGAVGIFSLFCLYILSSLIIEAYKELRKKK